MSTYHHSIAPHVLWSVYQEAHLRGDDPVCVWTLTKMASDSAIQSNTIEDQTTQKLWEKAIQEGMLLGYRVLFFLSPCAY